MNKYDIDETQDGFVIGSVTVRLNGKQTGFVVEYNAPYCNGNQRFGLAVYSSLRGAIAYGLAHTHDGHRAGRNWHRATQEERKQIAKAIEGPVRGQWERITGAADATVFAVQRSIYAATRTTAPISLERCLYDHKYVVNDIIKYRAAAIAAVHLPQLARKRTFKLLLATRERIAFEREWQSLVSKAEEMGIELRIRKPYISSTRLLPTEKLTLMETWPSLFSPTGDHYRSLNRTLMNLPARIPHRLLCNLSDVRLKRPVFERLELILLLLYAQHVGERREGRNEHVFMFAGKSQVEKAMQLVSEHTRNELKPSRSQDIGQLVSFLLDFPEEHRGNIVGLAEKSIRWHRDARRSQIEKVVQELGEQTKTAVPPISLPDQLGLRFLATVGDVCREAEDMEHCIASYAQGAVHGHDYLFHAKWEGQHATVQVGSRGHVIQALGPRNAVNSAAVWGRQALTQWGGGFPPVEDGQWDAQF